MTTFLLILCGLVVLLILYKVFTAPMRFLLKLALNTLLGFIALILLNTLGAGIGVALGVNWVNAVTIALLGVPGLALLLLIKWFLLT